MTIQAPTLSPQLFQQKEKALLQRLKAELNLPKLFKEVDKLYEFVGAKIVYVDHEYTVAVLREFQPICRKAPSP